MGTITEYASESAMIDAEHQKRLNAECRERLESLSIAPNYKINTDEKLAVDMMVFWQPIATCPRNVKVQLLGKFGVPAYGTYHPRETYWVMWCPLPRVPKL